MAVLHTFRRRDGEELERNAQEEQYGVPHRRHHHCEAVCEMRANGLECSVTVGKKEPEVKGGDTQTRSWQLDSPSDVCLRGEEVRWLDGWIRGWTWMSIP